MTVQDARTEPPSVTDADWAYYLADTALREAQKREQAVKINDPTADREIDVTGWDLDWLNDKIMKVRWDMLAGVDRELTDDEAEALSVAPGGGTEDPDARAAAFYWGLIIDEAIFQRDLPRALAKAADGGEVTQGELAAFERYVRELNEQVFGRS